MKEAELAVAPETQRTQTIASNLPKIGEWFWVTIADEKWDEEKGETVVVGTHEQLMCIEHIASNHIRFARYEAYDGSYRDTQLDIECVSFQQLMTHCRPEQNWRPILEKRMEEVRDEMARQTRLLYEDGQKANALPPSNSQFVPTTESPFALAIRTLDPGCSKKKTASASKENSKRS